MEPHTLQLGHSPDPDDAFMFYALAQDPTLVETNGWSFNHVLQDINTLSDRAIKGDLEITAISIASFPQVAEKYALTSCGASMGDGYGPRLVAREAMSTDDLAGKTIAIPGTLTSSFLALQLRLGKAGEAFQFQVVEFDEIPQHVADGKADAGLLIHEGQLTYADFGLHLIEDLGKWWKDRTDGLPLPLGGNCIRCDLGEQAMREVTGVLQRSIEYSLKHRDEAVKYSLQFGRGLDHDLADEFVGMYVNDWTLDYGEKGQRAIELFLKEGSDKGYIGSIDEVSFVRPG
ncbi:MAG: MqnA/MqnD/SBP family protein [Planctomycetota bacterium]